MRLEIQIQKWRTFEKKLSLKINKKNQTLFIFVFVCVYLKKIKFMFFIVFFNGFDELMLKIKKYLIYF
jgi:hypothetical protein